MSLNPALAALVGIPFVDSGRDPARDGGVDCWGLAILVGRVFGLEFPDFLVSCEDISTVAEIMTAEISSPRWVACEKAGPGRVLTFATDPKYPQVHNHVGVGIGGEWFIHTFRRHHSVKMRLDRKFWARKVLGVYEWIK